MATTSFFAVPGAPDPEPNVLEGLITDLNNKVAQANTAATTAVDAANSASTTAIYVSQMQAQVSQLVDNTNSYAAVAQAAATTATNKATEASSSASTAATNASAAASYATAASSSETNAASSASAASTSASSASTSATNAASSATSASASASTATTQASNASTSATNAAASAASASSYASQASLVAGNYTKIVATAGQTVFTATYQVGNEHVFLNGLKLVRNTDYTATNGTSITLTSGASSGAVVEVYVYAGRTGAKGDTGAGVPTGGLTGQVLAKASATDYDYAWSSAGSGTVSSVGVSVPTGLSVSGSPVTTTGTIAISLAAGYSIPTTANQSNWSTAYSWGNHASAGYLTTSSAASTYQPLDADLTSIAALVGTTGILTKTAANTWSLDTNTYLTTSSASSTYQTLSGMSAYLTTSAAASTYQPLDADLTSIGGLAGTSGFLKKTAANTWALDTGSYAPSTSGTSILKGNGSGGTTAATANTDYVSPTGADGLLTRWMFQDTGWDYFDSTTTATLNYVNGSVQRWTPSASSSPTLSITNWPPSGAMGELLIEAVNLGAAGTITWPTINWIKSDGTTTTTFGSNGVTVQSSGTDFILLWTRDAGTTIYGKFVR